MIGAFSKSGFNWQHVGGVSARSSKTQCITHYSLLYLEVMQYFTKLLAGEYVLQATTPLLVLC